MGRAYSVNADLGYDGKDLRVDPDVQGRDVAYYYLITGAWIRHGNYIFAPVGFLVLNFLGVFVGSTTLLPDAKPGLYSPLVVWWPSVVSQLY
jgi:hypothetical protein